ncbi:OmpH family outer membrane protein [Cryomorpha ignava]|uniref:OmpH family outer membrane protein n=1 Tax=Cryomorpha ignava TaxID=101383 RepID=A0A7K3WMN8_9FLAO|nr:OmpH family outer membrane protein [Cryomorpha ignava]NEN21965.1 OmpH family outer membrane protein [Cryomorpha ignava]
MKRIILLAVLTIGVMTQSMAQKFGHANFEEIVSLLPERAAAEKEVQDLQKKLEARLNSMVEAYQTKTADFQSDTTLTSGMRTSLRNEIADMEKRIQEFQQTAYTEIENKQNELMSKMIDKVRAAAVEVGKADSYTYIFDASNGSLLYAGGEDVTPKIKTKLGI